MSEQRYVPLPGSGRTEITDVEVVGPLSGEERIAATLVLRRRAELPVEVVEGSEILSRQQFADSYGADPADLAVVRTTLAQVGVDVVEADAASRRVQVEGPVAAMASAFGTDLTMVRVADRAGGETVEHRARTGELHIPAELDGIVTAVLGLDERRQASTRMRVLGVHPHAGPGRSYQPNALGAVYKFPVGTDGGGQTVGILELGGGFQQAELDTYFAGLGVSPSPSVTAVGVDGGANSPAGDPNSADGEVMLDIEVVGALAPKAKQFVYFAPNTDRGFLDALMTAVHADPTPEAVSISWGGPEDQWTDQARTAFDQGLADAAALGVTVTAASGDSGSTDGGTDGTQHTDFPASSPHVLACGGTNLAADDAGNVTSETVWNGGSGQGATGGGVSASFGLPSYQTNAGVPTRAGNGAAGRGVPDVAADADPASGYEVLVDGTRMVIGGTSAVAPLWAALVCRLAQSLGKPLGLIQARLYDGIQAGQAQPGFRDITQGDNGAYRAAAGWDACTGLGVPDGEALLKALAAPPKGAS